MMIRAHECVMSGAELAFSGKLMTVFSASGYCGALENQSAVLEMKSPDDYKIHCCPPLPYLRRKTAGSQPGVLSSSSFTSVLRRRGNTVGTGGPLLASDSASSIAPGRGRRGSIQRTVIKNPKALSVADLL